MSASSDLSRTSQTTNQVDQRLAAADQGVALGAYGQSSTVNLIDAAPDVLAKEIDALSGVSARALNVSENIVNTVSNLVGKLSEGSQDTLGAALQGNQAVIGAVTELGKTTATGGQSDFNKTLLNGVVAIVVGVVAVMIFRR